MRLELKKGLLFLFCSLFLFSFNSNCQTISLSDFAKEVKKDKADKGVKKGEKKAKLQLIRDNQLGLSIQIFSSITGNSKTSFKEDYYINGWSDQLYFESRYDFKSSFLRGYDVRLSYFKESFIPFGLYAGYGNANLFLGENSVDVVGLSDTSGVTNEVTLTPTTANYLLFGISKNISLSSTIYLGYVRFISEAIRTDFLQTTSFNEESGINFGFSYKLKSFVISLDNIVHLPYYKDSGFFNNSTYYEDEITEPKDFGNRFQLGVGYIF